MTDIGRSLVRSVYNWGRWPALISQDGRWLAVGSTNGVLQVWDLRNRGLFRQSALSTEAVFPWAFVDGGQKLVISQPNDFLHEWDLTMWNETRSWPAVNNMMSLVFSLNEQWCLTFKPGVLREKKREE